MQSFVATVISSKTAQTVSVEFSHFHKHPKYQKIIKRNTKLLVHNELSDVNAGDTVRIVKSRPYSKMKHFLLTEIISKKAIEKVSVAAKPQVEKAKVETPVKVKKTTKSKK